MFHFSQCVVCDAGYGGRSLTPSPWKAETDGLQILGQLELPSETLILKSKNVVYTVYISSFNIVILL